MLSTAYCELPGLWVTPTINSRVLAINKSAENFAEWQYSTTIKDEGKIYTACGDGKIPFISADDIAAVAFHALTDDEVPGETVRVLGPELLTYDEVCLHFWKSLSNDVDVARRPQKNSAKL